MIAIHPYYSPKAQRVKRWMLAATFLITVTAWANDLVEQPLAVRSGPRGATLFTVLPDSTTGVVTQNNYADPKMWRELYQEFSVGAMGTGVAIGDYDGDGRPDLFVVSKTESCRLFRNLGEFKFEDVTERAGVGDTGAEAGTWKQGATFVDVNNDGLVDIYLCRFGAPNRLYINQGNGTFKEEAAARGLAVSDASGMAAFCDYDRDGWLDVYIQTNLLNTVAHPHGQPDYLFHNNRDGTFTNVTSQAGIHGETQGHSATWWDYNNDDWPDLYVANDFAAPDTLYRNNRDGTFTNTLDRTVPHTPFSSMGADLGDVNNDGLIDLFVADMAATTHQKDQRGMADSRANSTERPGQPDIAPQYLRNALFLNTDTPFCQEGAMLAGLDAADWAWSVRFEDLDNDGRLDLQVTNGMNREQNNADLLIRQMSAESATERVALARNSPVLAEENLAFRNLGDLRFENVSAAWGLNQKGVSFGAAFGDLDGDGDLDLVIANFQSGVTVLRNDSDSGHRVIIDLRGVSSNRFGVGAKAKLESKSGVQIRQLTLARGYLSSSEPMLHFGLGDDVMIERLTITWPSGQIQTLQNLPVDRHFTITEPSTSVPPPAVTHDPAPTQYSELSQSTGLAWQSHEQSVDETYLQRLIPVRLNRRGPGLAVGPIARQNQDDIIIGGSGSDPARVLLHIASAQYTRSSGPIIPSDPNVDDGPILLFDANGDGRNDLLITGGGNIMPAGAPEYQPRLLLNDGQAGFHSAPAGTLPELSTNAGAVAAADFEHNGRLGVFIGGRVETGQYPLPPPSVLLANRNGRFVDVTDTFAPGLRDVGMVTSALWTDVDADGWPDLLLTLEWGHVKYFHNQQGRGLEDLTAPAGFATAGTGWWNSIAAADFNGDGRPDYVVGNLGLNTQYRASADHPALLFSGDFKGRDAPQIIEAYYEGDMLYPWRTRKDLGALIPSILKRFPKNDFYARASLGEILGKDNLAAAQR